MKISPIAAALCALTLSLPAQDERTALSFTPADAVFIAWADGPDALREVFGDTRLGQLLGGPEIESMIAPLLEDSLQAWDQDIATTGLDSTELREMFLGYQGRILFAMGFDAERLVDTFPDPDFDELAPWILMVATPDGNLDFDRVASMYEDYMENAGEENLVEIDSNGRSFLSKPMGQGHMTVPFVEAGHLVMTGGADLEAVLDRCLHQPDDNLGAAQLTLPTGQLGLWLQLGPMVKSLRAMGDTSDDPELSLGMKLILDTLGLGSFDTVSVAARAAGEHSVVDMKIQLAGDDRGLLGAMMSPGRGTPTALDLVPMQREVWSITPMDIDSLYESIGQMVDELSDQIGMSRNELEGQFTEFFRVRLKEDLIDHLGTELLSVGTGSIDLDEDEPDPTAAFQGVCYGFTLDDATAFGKSFETLLRSRGLHAARKTEDYRGVKVRRIPFLGSLFYYAISERVFLAALGEPGAAELRAILDEELDRREGVARPDFPDAIAERLDHAVTGWQGIAASNLSIITGAFMTALEQQAQAGMIGAEIEMVREVMNTVVDLVNRYDLATMISVTRTEGDTTTMQMIW